MSAFNDSATGVLSAIGSSPFADNQTAPCWVEISHDGRFLFTVNTASGTISRYSIADDGELADAPDATLVDVQRRAIGAERGSTAPTPPVAPTGVLPSSVS